MVRYHSLAVDEATLPACLEPIAWARGVLPSASRHCVAAATKDAGAAAEPAGDAAAAGLGQPPQNGAAVSAGLSAHGVQRGGSHVNGHAPSVLMGLAHRERPHCAVRLTAQIVKHVTACWGRWSRIAALAADLPHQ